MDRNACTDFLRVTTYLIDFLDGQAKTLVRVVEQCDLLS